MKFVTYAHNGAEKVGILHHTEEYIIHMSDVIKSIDPTESLPETMQACIELGDRFVDQCRQALKWIDDLQDEGQKYLLSVQDVRLLAPIPRPAKNIFCVGRNYSAHAREMGASGDLPQYPMVFSKVPTTVIGPEETILNHQDVTNSLDYEGELAVVIGKQAQGVREEEAMDYVFGYTIINDVTARDLVKRYKHYLLGKSLDASCPMGPCLVHRSAIPDPGNLKIETKVNGEIRQSARTDQFIFSIPEIIATINQGTTLEPGDIISTGTPAGVGNGFQPPKFLKPGDVIEIEIEGIGLLKNQVEK